MLKTIYSFSSLICLLFFSSLPHCLTSIFRFNCMLLLCRSLSLFLSRHFSPTKKNSHSLPFQKATHLKKNCVFCVALQKFIDSLEYRKKDAVIFFLCFYYLTPFIIVNVLERQLFQVFGQSVLLSYL